MAKDTSKKSKTSGQSAPKKKGKKELAKKKTKKRVPEGIVHIAASFNNTIITITDTDGNVIASASPGMVGFSGTRGSTAFAAAKAAESLLEKISRVGMQEAKVYIKGPGQGRNSAVKALAAGGLKITLLSDVTPIPHNGCRRRKAPRK